jgi:Baseplate J-like protein
MPLQLPNLDDRNYTDLVEEARSLIPTYAPDWTNHNASDPGITLIELFASLSEILIYRLNRVTTGNVLSFLKLLNGPDWKPMGKDPAALTPAEIMQAVPVTILQLRKLERAVACGDFETLALEADGRVGRARCLPRLNIEVDTEKEKAGHVSLIILPKSKSEPDLLGVLATVEKYLEPRLLLTTRLHVVGPQYLPVRIEATVVPLTDQLESDVKTKVVQAVKDFLDPLTGGDQGNGWPFGRNVFVSEIYSLLDQIAGVDYVQSKSVKLKTTTAGRELNNAANELLGIEVKSYELVAAQITDADVTVAPS